MLYVLLCDYVAAGMTETREAVDGALAKYAAETITAGPAGPGPDPATWGLLPHQRARAERLTSTLGGAGR